jgi:hypothetical protein
MAKSKRSAALFEVIQSSRLQRYPAPIVPRRWWFTRRSSKPSLYGSALPGMPELAVIAPPVTEPDAAEPAEDLLDSAYEEPANEAGLIHSTSGHRQPIPGVDLQLDPDHQQITFKVSYYSAIVTTFTIVVVVGLAYLIGRKVSHAPIAATLSPSSAQLRAQGAHPDVLDVANHDTTARQVEIDTHSGDTHSGDTHSGDNAQLATSKITPTAAALTGGQRIIGRQYVVIQIYSDKKSADDAGALLAKNNIACTVENGLTGWATNKWWCIVGTTGFDHVRGNADYQKYVDSINQISAHNAGVAKFKRFEPRAYRWKESTT